jgi:hypothetical protein
MNLIILAATMPKNFLKLKIEFGYKNTFIPLNVYIENRYIIYPFLGF